MTKILEQILIIICIFISIFSGVNVLAQDIYQPTILPDPINQVLNTNTVYQPTVLPDPTPTVAPPANPTNGPIKISLNVPFHRQQYNLSCEMASVAMAMWYKGVNVSEDELLNILGVSPPFSKYTFFGETYWGDPDEGFVGDVRGVLSKRNMPGLTGATGWGANVPAVLRVAKVFRNNSYGIRNGRNEDIQYALEQGNPVVIWHVRDNYANLRMDYKTLSGKSVTMLHHHVFTVYGYERNHNGEVFYFINDPWWGRLTLKEGDFNRQWERYNRDMVVVV